MLFSILQYLVLAQKRSTAENITDKAANSISVSDIPDSILLSTTTYDKFIAENDLTLINFFAPWCSHCMELEPLYHKAAVILMQNKHPLKIARVDCTTDLPLCTKLGIDRYPTLTIFKYGIASPFNGDRSDTSIVFHMQKFQNLTIEQRFRTLQFVPEKNLMIL
jgi:protein disulfide-isomerase-like protein